MQTENSRRDKEMRSFSFFIFSFSLMILFTISSWAGLSRDGSGVVADSTTGLAWQDDYSDNEAAIKSATWQEAIIYCEELTLGGKSDWRVPNIKELKSIADKSRYTPAIDSTFVHVASNLYWSSTTYASDSTHAWNVNFYNGAGIWDGKSFISYVRCVRGGN